MKKEANDFVAHSSRRRLRLSARRSIGVTPRRVHVLLVLFIICLTCALAACQSKADEDSGDAIADTTASAPATQSSVSDEPDIPRPTGDVVEIKEKLFVGQLNDIYINPDDYVGKTIKYEGKFTQYTETSQGITYYMVYRDSPGCCGADGQAGFEVIWADASDKTYPEEDDWCEVVGVLVKYEENGRQYLRIDLTSLTVKLERGAEFVSQ